MSETPNGRKQIQAYALTWKTFTAGLMSLGGLFIMVGILHSSLIMPTILDRADQRFEKTLDRRLKDRGEVVAVQFSKIEMQISSLAATVKVQLESLSKQLRAIEQRLPK